jgi:S1-C subfamily serine protease
MLGGTSINRRALLSLGAIVAVLSAAACAGNTRRDTGAHYCYDPNSDLYYEHTSYDCPADHFAATEEAYRNYLERASQPQPSYRYCWDLAKGHPYTIATGTCQHDDLAMSDAEIAAYRSSGQPPAAAATQPAVAENPAPPQPVPPQPAPAAPPPAAASPQPNNQAASKNESDLQVISAGTSFFVSENGHLLTNHHVIDGCDQMLILTADGDYPAQVIDSNAELDLALLKVDKSGMPFATFAAWLPEAGDTAYAIGYPLVFELGAIKITDGIVSGLSGFGGDLTRLQLSVPLQPGNSGGPLFDETGLVIGVISEKIVAEDVEGVSFAITPEAAGIFLLAQHVRPTVRRSDVTRKARDIMRDASRFTWPALCLARPPA